MGDVYPAQPRQPPAETPVSRTRRFLAQLGQPWGAVQRQQGYGPSTPAFVPRGMHAEEPEQNRGHAA